jgi:hypothetical protein
MTQPLSPSAQAVLDAALPHMVHRYSVAAALRAARDELDPNKTIKDIDYVPQAYVDGYSDALDEILALAIELEA